MTRLDWQLTLAVLFLALAVGGAFRLGTLENQQRAKLLRHELDLAICASACETCQEAQAQP